MTEPLKTTNGYDILIGNFGEESIKFKCLCNGFSIDVSSAELGIDPGVILKLKDKFRVLRERHYGHIDACGRMRGE